MLERDLGMTPVYLRYNSGLRVSDNGRELAVRISELVAAFPRPIESLTLIGHSMGGLVCRSAVAHAATADRPWVPRVRAVICLGSPHLGAPLERATHALASALRVFDTPGTQVPAAILEARSAGVKDMRSGGTDAAGRAGRDSDARYDPAQAEAPFVDGVAYYYAAGTVTDDPSHPLAAFVGDGVVPPSAASGARDPERRLPFRDGRVFGGIDHLRLANHPDVYAQIRDWLVHAAA
jgi:pimeloyl-ACP methyl ester carboxylesterase